VKFKGTRVLELAMAARTGEWRRFIGCLSNEEAEALKKEVEAGRVKAAREASGNKNSSSY
jgi:hypothetical protein